ncbi:MAG TPA: TonB-dependent receptor [Bryobacteraceae bacterium]|nr:TonB-dependent receptor [Bryobacteraceae bacterium]
MTSHCLTFLFLAAGTIALQAQTADTAILGRVTDPSGSVVPKATVTVAEKSTGVTRSATTGSEGNFEVRYLVPGEYSVEAGASGFRSERQTGVTIQIGQQARINFTLQVGPVQQTLEVHTSAPLLQTENATLGSVVGVERTVDLPLNGRQFDDLAVLTPGVVVSDVDLHSTSTGGALISANGQRPIWDQVNVDGVSMVDNRHAYFDIYPSVDAIEEFKVQTGNFSAEYGVGAGANTNIQIKSGTNQFHGDAFEFLRNYDLDARNFFVPAPHPKNILKQNQFGATFGGPIVRNKTFFFVSYEGLRSIAEAPSTSVVLTPAQRSGNFSGSSNTITDPLNNGAPFPGNMIPSSRLDPVAANIVNQYMPLPNTSGTTNYTGASLGDLSTHQGIARIDEYLSSKDQLFAHIIVAHRSFPDTNINPYFHFTGDSPTSNYQVQYVHTFSPTLLNELRAGADLEDVSQLSVRTNTNFTIESLGINGMLVGGPNGRPLRKDEEGFPVITISGYIGMGDGMASSNLDNSKTAQVVDNLTWVRGVHTLKFGADIRRNMDDATTNNWPFGSMTFTSDIANDAAASYMLGFPRTVLTPEGVPLTAARQWRMGFYGQDDWKVTPNLTLNLGLRYDLYTIPQDVNNVTRTLNFATNPPTLYPAPGQALSPLWYASHKNFAPRLGFAYNAPAGFVVRGGYGIFYYGGQFDNLNILQLNPPTAGSLTLTNPALPPLATIENPIPAALYPANPFFNAVTLPPDRTHPNTYAQDWNLQISHQLGANDMIEVGYVGSKGTHVDTSMNNYNQPTPGPGAVQARRPYPNFSGIRMEYFGVNTIFHSLQAHYEHRFNKGLSVTLAYTFSHLIDDAGYTINEGGCVCQIPSVTGNRDSSVLDQRHRFVAGYVWELPFAKNLHGLAGVVADGWALNGIITFASGNPFHVGEAADTQNDAGTWEYPNLNSSQSVTIANPGPSLWFNTAAFSPSVLQYGTAPRDPVVGPGTHTADLSLFKTFKMPFNEQHSLQFRMEVFNSMNTPEFSNPGASLGTSTFGVITSTKINNRILQFALKYRF